MGIKGIFRITVLFVFFISGKTLSAQTFAKGEYSIALVLPFKTTGYHGSVGEAMLDYYEGFRMAAADLEKEGLKLKLYVFDSEKDSQALQTIFAHPDMKRMDVIVGPVYENQMKETEDFCNDHGSILVSPLKFCKPQSSKTDMINFFVPDSVRIASIATKAAKLYPNYKFYLATDNSAKSKEYMGYMKRALALEKIKNPKSLLYTGAPIAASAVAKDSIIILSTIAKTSSKDPLLKAIVSKKHAFLFAHADWHNGSISTLEVDEPKVIYPEMNYTSTADSSAAHFRKNFMDKTFAEPSKYAYIGYDQATYLCYGLMTYGKDFINHLPNAEYRGFINVIHLEKNKYGILNTGLNYIQIIDEERREFEP